MNLKKIFLELFKHKCKFRTVGYVSNRWIDQECIKCKKQKILDMEKISETDEW